MRERAGSVWCVLGPQTHGGKANEIRLWEFVSQRGETKDRFTALWEAPIPFHAAVRRACALTLGDIGQEVSLQFA